MNLPKNLLITTVASIAALPMSLSAQEMEVEIALEDAPEAVQATIAEHLNGGEIREIEREGGKYSVEIVNGTTVSEIEIGADGEYLGLENEGAEGEDDEDEAPLSLADAPEAVRQAVADSEGSAVQNLTRETENGAVVYEAEWEADGVEHSIEFSEAGDVLEREHGISVDDLPEAARAAIAERYPSSEIQEAEHIEMVVYDVEVTTGAETREVQVNAAGQITEEEHEGEDEEDEGEGTDRPGDDEDDTAEAAPAPRQ